MLDKKVHFVGAVHPIRTELIDVFVPEGETLEEMLRRAQPDPILLRDAVVFIDDVEIPRENWRLVRPKAGHQVIARAFPVPRGGGGGGGSKDPLRTVLTIAVIAASFYFGPMVGGAILPEGFTIGSLTAAQTASAVGGTLISVAGSLLTNMIAPVRAPQLPTLSGSGGSQESPSLYLTGSANQERPFEGVPCVLGFFRFKPPKGAKTYTEVLGDHNILRDLFVVAYGELELSEWLLGNTPITSFSDYELEVDVGDGTGTGLTTYPGQVFQDEFSVKLEQTASWQQRNTTDDADEISVDVAFPRGLVYFDAGGARTQQSVTIEVEWREVGAVTWNPLPALVDATFDTSWIVGSEVTFTHARSVAIRHGMRWKTGLRGQYEVRLRRTTSDTSSTQISDEIYWVTLRSFTNEDPINFPLPLAKAGLKIRSTNQLNGVVDDLSVLAKSVVLDWDSGTSTWVRRVSNNPASLFRHVAQGPAKAIPIADANLDLVRLQEWHEFCALNGFTYNKVHDYVTNVQDILADIASAGRAGLTIEDGKWSVVIDEPQDYPITHITPRNSYGFEGEKAFLDLPHAWRVRFPNEELNYKQDERIVYRDGYSSANATVFDQIEFPGITNPDHIWKAVRFASAHLENRPERWTVSQDFEYLVARRGSRVKITHDVMLVGLASGRIKSLTTNGSGDVTSITVDEELVMEGSKEYGLVVRRDVSGDVSLSIKITTVIGTATTVTPITPVPAASAPEIGDLFGFGEFGAETEDATVLSVESQSEFSGRLILVPYRAAVYTADSGTIPAHVPTITEDVYLPAVNIQSVITDESVLERGAGDATLVRAEIRVEPISRSRAYLEVQQSRTGSGETFYDSVTTMRAQNTIRIGDVQQGETYDFRVRWNEEGFLPGPWTPYPGVRIIGRSSNPSGLTGATLSVFGGQVHVRWSEPSELDVRFGGQVRFRHSSSFADPAWSESTSIGEAANARSLFAALPLKPGTYIARVFDADGNPSDTIVSLSTKQASVLQYANVSTIDEAPAFSGVKSGVVVKGVELEMEGAGQFDDIPDLDAITNLDYYGGVVPTATYVFAGGFDFLAVKRVRLTSRMTTLVENISDTLDERTSSIDSWEDFDGTNTSQADVQVWERHTDDDPAGTPTWSVWNRLDSAEFEARGFEFEARFYSNDPSYDIHVSELGVDAEEVV